MSLRDKIQATLSKCRSLEEMIDVLKAATGNGEDTEFEAQIVGEIPAAIAEKVPQLIAAPIILDKSGVDHIADRCEKVLKNLKMTAVEFVKSIIDGFDRIYTDKDYTDRFQLVCTNTKTSKLAVIGIKKEGNAYRVMTAMPIRNARLKKETLLWEGAANLHAVSAATTPPLDVNSAKVASGENINNSDQDVNSENEKNFEVFKRAAESIPFLAKYVKALPLAKETSDKIDALFFADKNYQANKLIKERAARWSGREDEFIGQAYIDRLGERKYTATKKGEKEGTLDITVTTTKSYDILRKTDMTCEAFLDAIMEYALHKSDRDALFQKNIEDRKAEEQVAAEKEQRLKAEADAEKQAFRAKMKKYGLEGLSIAQARRKLEHADAEWVEDRVNEGYSPECFTRPAKRGNSTDHWSVYYELGKPNGDGTSHVYKIKKAEYDIACFLAGITLEEREARENAARAKAEEYNSQNKSHKSNSSYFW